MCVALPGVVIQIKDDYATVDFDGNKVEARGASLLNIQMGDKVLVHAGCIIQKVSDEDSDILNEIMREVGAF